MDIGADKCFRRRDRPVDMALRGKVDNRSWLMLGEQRANLPRIADVTSYQDVPLVSFERREILRIARIGQQVKIYHRRPDAAEPA